MEHYKETTTRKPAEAYPQLGGKATPTTIARNGKSKKGSLISRAAALVFSVISFIIMTSVKSSNESRYVMAGGILSTIYNVFQVSRQSYYLLTGKSLFEQRTTSLIDYYGDQIIAYLLISCASTGFPTVAALRTVKDYETSNLVAASTGMAFLAFYHMAVSAMESAYKLMKRV